VRKGSLIPYPTLHRFAVAELDFGRTAATVPVADGSRVTRSRSTPAGLTLLRPDERGRRRRMRAWIFTAVLSGTASSIPASPKRPPPPFEACEAAWTYYGGVFRVLLPDNTKGESCRRPIPSIPRSTPAFLEYAQAAASTSTRPRVRHAKDKARVERSVPSVRDDCFGGEILVTSTRRSEHAPCMVAPRVRHPASRAAPSADPSSTSRPKRSRALAGSNEPYDVPLWMRPPRSIRRHFAQVGRALYSFADPLHRQDAPSRAIGTPSASTTARSSSRRILEKPPGRSPWIGPISRPTKRLLRPARHRTPQATSRRTWDSPSADSPRCWIPAGTRMRRVYALLGLVKKYGRTASNPPAPSPSMRHAQRPRLQRMLEAARTPQVPAPDKLVPIARSSPDPRAVPLAAAAGLRQPGDP